MSRIPSLFNFTLSQASIINVRPYPTGNHSWNTAMGANMAKVPPKYGEQAALSLAMYLQLSRGRPDAARARDATLDVTRGIYSVWMSSADRAGGCAGNVTTRSR